MELSSEYNYYTYHRNYVFRTEIPGVLYINRSCRLDIMTWHDLIKKGYWTVIVYFNIGWRKEVFGHLRHWPLHIQGGAVYRIEKNNRALIFFEKNNRALKFFEKNNCALIPWKKIIGLWPDSIAHQKEASQIRLRMHLRAPRTLWLLGAQTPGRNGSVPQSALHTMKR